MTFAPATLVTLGRYWTAVGGVNLGVVGDVAHQAKGTSYHLGKDQLQAGAYSAVTRRDRAGLSNAASAIDLGRLNGSLGQLRSFSSWLVTQARANKPGTSDMREIIYSPDGKAVLRWDRERGYTSLPRAGEADLSHLTHTHVSWYRDAESRDHTVAFRPYFAGATPPTPPDTSTEEDMVIPVGKADDYLVKLTIGDQLFDETFKPIAKVTKAQTVAGMFTTGTGYLAIAYGPSAGVPLRLLFVLRANVEYTVDDSCAPIQKQLDIANGRIRAGVTALGGTLP